MNAAVIRRRSNSRGNRVVPAIVFTMFILFGGVMAWFLFVRPVLRVQAARSWPAMPCQVLSSEVRSHRGSKGGTTYSVHVHYRHHVGGQDYESRQYDFLGGSSSGRAGKAAIVARYRPGTDAICYVNPRDPADAVLERGFTPVMLVGLFPLLFLAIGIGGLTWVMASRHNAPIANAAAPWLARADWAAGRIVSATKTGMIVAWVVAVFWNAVSWPVVFLLREELAKGNKAILFGLWFPAVGLGLLAWAIHATLRWRKFGNTVFEMASVPGVIGGALDGRIRLNQFLRPVDGIHTRLTCVHRRTTGSGKHRSTHETVLWQDQRQSAAGIADAIAVRFAIPADCRETGTANPDDQIVWRLDARAQLPGVDFAAQFEVPVFKTGSRPPEWRAVPAGGS